MSACVLGITNGAADFLGPSVSCHSSHLPDHQGIRVCSVSPSIVQSKMLGERWPYFGGELEACAIFPRRAAEAMEIVDGIMYLLGNSMMNAFDVRSETSALTCSSESTVLGEPFLTGVDLKIVSVFKDSTDVQLARMHPAWSRKIVTRCMIIPYVPSVWRCSPDRLQPSPSRLQLPTKCLC